MNGRFLSCFLWEFLPIRDEWVYDFDINTLTEKIQYFSTSFNKNLGKNTFDESIKWSATLKSLFKSHKKLLFDKKKIVQSIYRPFIKCFFYFDELFDDRLTNNHKEQFGQDGNAQNFLILFLKGERLHFNCFGTKQVANMALLSLDPMQCLPLYRYDSKRQPPRQHHRLGLKPISQSLPRQPHYQGKHFSLHLRRITSSGLSGKIRSELKA
jgi:predicted helicase